MPGNTKERALRHKFGKHVTAATITSALRGVFALLLIKILTMVLPKNDFGLYSLWLSFAVLVATFSFTAFTASIWRFMPRRKSSEDGDARARLFSASYLGSISNLFVMLIVFLLLFGLGNFMIYEAPDYLWILGVVFFVSLALILREVTLVLSGSEQNSREILVYNISCNLGSVVVASAFALLYRDYIMVLLGLGLGYLIPAIMAFLIKESQYKIARPTVSDFKQIVGFGGPSVLVSSVVKFIPFLTSFSVGLWLGESEIGTLAVALSTAGILAFVLIPTQTAYQAYLVNAFETNNVAIGIEVARKVEEIILVASVLVGWLIFVFSPLLVELFSTSEYLDAVTLMPFVIVSTLLISLSYFLKVRIDLVEKPHLTAIAFFLSAFTLAVSFSIFIPRLGLLGIGFALVLQAATVFALMFYFSDAQLPVRPNLGFLLSLFISSTALILIYWVLTHLGADSYIAGIISALIYLVFVNRLGNLTVGTIKRIAQMLLGVQS